MNSDNPFVDYGSVVGGERFVGRNEELGLIDNRLFSVRGYGSLSIVGLPRVGKTSLITEAVRRAAPKLRDIRAVVVRAELGTVSSADQLFHGVVKELLEKSRAEGWCSEHIEYRATQLLGQSGISFPGLRGVFGAIHQAGLRAVVVLDEFDSGRHLFTDRPECFHWIRELSSNPEFKAGIVLVSKRRLADVAHLAGYDSDYWANVFMPLTLRTFRSDEAPLLLSPFCAGGLELEEETLCEIRSMCGTHPYLLDAYAFHVWQRLSQGHGADVHWLRLAMRAIVRDYYQQVVTILDDMSLLAKFAQVVNGPQWDLTRNDVDAMVDYGVLSEQGDDGLRTFSDGFAECARFVEQVCGIWPLFTEVERGIREALETRLTLRFGSDWQEDLKRHRPGLAETLVRASELMRKEKARFGATAAAGLLGYTYPLELFQIMAADWPALGEPLLGADKNAWSVKLGLLAKIRTPLAHSRDEVVTPADRLQAEGICREILERLNRARTNSV